MITQRIGSVAGRPSVHQCCQLPGQNPVGGHQPPHMQMNIWHDTVSLSLAWKWDPATAVV